MRLAATCDFFTLIVNPIFFKCSATGFISSIISKTRGSRSHHHHQVQGVFSCSVTNGFSGWAETYFNPPDEQTYVFNHSLQEAIGEQLLQKKAMSKKMVRSKFAETLHSILDEVINNIVETTKGLELVLSFAEQTQLSLSKLRR